MMRKGSWIGYTLALLLIVVCSMLWRNSGWHLVLRNVDTGQRYARYAMSDGDWFSVKFDHSVNKSPVTDYYQIKAHDIYVEKTIYYDFGAGVQTELEGNETLTYGKDGSMIISGFDKKMSDLTYFVGTVSDHILVVNDGAEISLRNLCGRNSKVAFTYEYSWF